ncbi:MAG: recombination protein NinG [Sulfurovaceae bacterium]
MFDKAKQLLHHKSPKIYKCKICGKVTGHRQRKVCSVECALIYSKEKAEKQKKSEALKIKKAYNQNDKTYLIKKAQDLINKYARLRDEAQRGHICCSCTGTGKMDGGHFLPVSTYKAIRFNVNQIHQQCVKCNQYNSGMRHEYREFMVNKYGDGYVEHLESHKGITKSYSIEYLNRLIKIVNKKIRKQKSINEIHNER